MNSLLKSLIYIPFLLKWLNSLPKIWYEMEIYEDKYNENFA